MYSFEIKPELKKKLDKLQKKDIIQLKAIRNKIAEVILNPDHYKNLKYGLKKYKSVHVVKSFVLTFHVSEQDKVVEFVDYDHHDKIYLRRD
jgi:YafQ family addiction module toxin component